MNDYQKEQQAHRDLLWGLAQGIASHLDGWEAVSEETNSGRARIEHETGAAISLHVDDYGKRDRVGVYGRYPNHPRRKNNGGSGYGSYPLSGVDTPNITCAISRGHEAIAKDITRRFMDKHLDCHELAVKRIAEQEGYLDDQEAMMLKLADFLGVETRGTTIYTYGTPSIVIKNPTRDTVTFEIRSVPLDIAVQICEVVKGAT